MSHGDTATVWSVLSGRQDSDQVLRELIGTHFLTVSLTRRDSVKLRAAFIFHVVTLRVIFDLQRSYLQSYPRSRESTSSLLPQEVLFSAVFHLLGVVVTGCTSCPDLSNEGPYNRLTIHAAFSGLRALILHKKPLTALEAELLSIRVNEIHDQGHWHGTEYTLLLRMCRQAVQALTSPTPDERFTEPTCSTANLPDFFSGLYIFQGHEDSIINASRNIGNISLQSSTWFCECLALYDLFWSTTAALIQLCLIRQGASGAVLEPHTSEKAKDFNYFYLVLNIRLLLQKQAGISPGVTPEDWTAKQLRASLLQDVCLACAEARCQCFETDSKITQELRTQHGLQPSFAQLGGEDFPESSFNSEIRKALGQLHVYLEGRAHALMRPQAKLAILGVESTGAALSLHSYAEPTGFQQAAIPFQNEERKEQINLQHRPLIPHSVSYPLTNGPNSTSNLEHPVVISSPPSTIFDATKTSTQPYSSNESSCTNTTNPETTAGSEVFSHRSPQSSSATESPRLKFRQIDQENFPEVHRLATEIYPPQTTTSPALVSERFLKDHNSDMEKQTPSCEQPQPWQPDHDNHLEAVPSHSLTRPAPSIMSQESSDSRSYFHKETSHSRPKKWEGLFGSSRNRNAFSPPSFTFFASGKSLLIWNEVGAGYYDLPNMDPIQFRRINASSVFAAAGGKKRCAVVVKGVSEYRLEVYEGRCDVPLHAWKLDSLPQAIAFSRNDNLVAAKFSRVVDIFQIDVGSTFRHDLPPQKGRSGRGNHAVAFSSDSLSFVATTRYEPEKVVSYWSECHSSSNAAFVECTAPTGFPGDNGLSGLVCSNTRTRAAFLTTFTEKGFPTFLSLTPAKLSSRAIRDLKGRVGTRIHHAALCPLGTNLVLLNQRNDLYWVDDCWTGMQEPRKVGTIKRSVSVVREVELGMPNIDEVYLFWVEKGKGMLVTMGKGGGKTRPIELVVDLEVLVA